MDGPCQVFGLVAGPALAVQQAEGRLGDGPGHGSVWAGEDGESEFERFDGFFAVSGVVAVGHGSIHLGQGQLDLSPFRRGGVFGADGQCGFERLDAAFQILVFWPEDADLKAASQVGLGHGPAVGVGFGGEDGERRLEGDDGSLNVFRVVALLASDEYPGPTRFGEWPIQSRARIGAALPAPQGTTRHAGTFPWGGACR